MTAIRTAMGWLRVSVVLTLIGLALMIWSIVDPRPTPVITAMTVGQGVGTAAFVIYLVVVLADLRRARVLADEEPAEPAEPSAKPKEEPSAEAKEEPSAEAKEEPSAKSSAEPKEEPAGADEESRA